MEWQEKNTTEKTKTSGRYVEEEVLNSADRLSKLRPET